MAEGLEALLHSAQVTLNPASKTLPSAEERRAEAAAAESLAASCIPPHVQAHVLVHVHVCHPGT